MSPEVQQAELQRLLDERSITRAVLRWARGSDRNDRPVKASVFHDDAVDHHGGFHGTIAEFLDHAEADIHPRFSGTAHYVTNVLVDVRGDVAYSEAYLLGVNVTTDKDEPAIEWFGGRYLDRFERRDGEWRIAERTLVQDWSHTHPCTAVPRWLTGYARGARDRSDPLYSFP